MASKVKKIQTISIPEFRPEDMPMSCTWIIIGPPGTGKCLALDTPVMMYDGSTSMVQHIKTGQQLMGDDFQPRNVLSTTSGRDVMYEVTQDNGMTYVVNEAHILCLKYLFPISLHKENTSDDLKIQCWKAIWMKDGGLQVKSFTSEDEGIEFIDSLVEGTDFSKFTVFEISVKEYVALPSDHVVRSCFGYKAIKPNEPYFKHDPLSSISVKQLDDGDYYGFQIDGNGRFLLGDYTVTHNTTLME
jgi:hypothetical protein